MDPINSKHVIIRKMVRLKFTCPPAGGKVAEDYFLVPGKSEFAKQINISKDKNISLIEQVVFRQFRYI